MQYLWYKLSQPFPPYDTHVDALYATIDPSVTPKTWDAYEHTCDPIELSSRIQCAVDALVHLEHLPIRFYVAKFSNEAILTLPSRIQHAFQKRLLTLYDSYHKSPLESHKKHMVAHLMTVCCIHIEMSTAVQTLATVKHMVPFALTNEPVPADIHTLAKRIGHVYDVTLTEESIQYCYEAYAYVPHPNPSLSCTPLLLLYLFKMYQCSTTEGLLTITDVHRWVLTIGVMATRLEPKTRIEFTFPNVVGGIFDSVATYELFCDIASSILEHINVNKYWIDHWTTSYRLHGSYREEKVGTYVTVHALSCHPQPPVRKMWADEDSEDDDDFFSKPVQPY